MISRLPSSVPCLPSSYPLSFPITAEREKKANIASDHLLSANCQIAKRVVRPPWLQRTLQNHFDGVKDNVKVIEYLLNLEFFFCEASSQ